MNDLMICHECGQSMTKTSRPVALSYKGQSISLDLPGWYCACGESVHSGKDMNVSDRALNLLKARAEGLLEPARIRAIREKLGLSQRKASQIIGGGPNAFHKYEQGDVLVSRAVSNLLRLLEANPGQLALLRDDPRVMDHEPVLALR
ncbi:MAG: type II toxin-antitoxin system MqsA family antitoxin [Magnetococcales bacterium]|nr:type II toxin-antitoxin system MqsA family antitoxin [Magnetococcales bacterium]MBF0150290.1 type II toxin-antitoxin system MqsA family antitoxin [Magnetococcales bacterium]MBF0632749.1 type II toxin-antitoxin system MqsA family antitoxin [Magnetococcales bacterium]